MKVLAVIPIIKPETADVCIESLLKPDNSSELKKEDILLVDNSKDGFAGKYGLRVYRDPEGHNLGVARSWNVGAREVLAKSLDYLVVVSASMLFGPIMHQTLKGEIEKYQGEQCIEAMGHSWHLIAFHRELFKLIGLFDENFYPAYEEGIDFGRRMELAGVVNWRRIWINALSQGVALHLDAVSCPVWGLKDYYRKKWGGEKGQEKYDRPFGDKPLSYWESVPIPELAKKYGLDVWY